MKHNNSRIPKIFPFELPTADGIELCYKNKNKMSDILEAVPTNFFTDLENNVILNGGDIILSDNFFALHKLINQKQKIDLVYLDPPYNTGNEFNSRSQKFAYSDVYGLAPYIETLRIRLVLLRELLADEGSIYLHIGHQMLGYVKVIMDEIFGINNFKNIITRRKCSSKNYTKNQYPNLNDYILFYTKSKNYIWNQQGEFPDEEWILKEYNKEDHKGRYKLVPIHAPGLRNGETGKEWKGKLPPKGKHWQYTPEKLDLLDKNGDLYWSKNGNPRRKVYLAEEKKLPFTDYWKGFRDAHHQSIAITGYPTEKNIDMLRMIVKSSSNPDSIVLDPFCGSGSTLHAAHFESRQWIGIDQSMEAIKNSIGRFKNGVQEMGDYVAPLSDTKLKMKPLSKNKFRFVANDNIIDINEYKKLLHSI